MDGSKQTISESQLYGEKYNHILEGTPFLTVVNQYAAVYNYKDYMQAIRTEHGYRQLVETDMTISDISMENGFPNNKAFSKAFYKKYGIMPAQFRKRQKNAINKISN